MTPEARNIAIAEALGWECVHAESYSDGQGGFTYGPRGMPPHSNLRRAIPDYCNDLNAMFDAEKLLSVEQWQAYIRQLSGPMSLTIQLHKNACHATAAKRAEALLRTLGKWTDEKPSS